MEKSPKIPPFETPMANKARTRSPTRESIAQHLRSADKTPMSKDEIIKTYFNSIPLAVEDESSIQRLSNSTKESRDSSVPTIQAEVTNEQKTAETSRTDSVTPHPYHNSGDTCVCVRIKPLEDPDQAGRLFQKKRLQYEISDDASTRIPAYRGKALKVHLGYEDRKYNFANVFDRNATNTDINKYLWPIVHTKLTGHSNVSVMCYGQTGSGKTYTINAIFPSITKSIFSTFSRDSGESKNFAIGYVQIYCDTAYDLLCTDATGEVMQTPLDLGQPILNNPSLEKKIPTVPVRSAEEALEIIENARKRRIRRNHSLNRQSSRSHTFIFLSVPTDLDASLQVTFIDLAGSERVKRTGSVGQAFEEGVSINRSLSSLSRVFSSIQRERDMMAGSLHGNNRSYLFRGSLFTRYIYSISNAFFILIANISCEASSASETKNTLDFASMSQKIHTVSSPRNDRSSNPDFIPKAISENVEKIPKNDSHIQQMMADLRKRFAELCAARESTHANLREVMRQLSNLCILREENVLLRKLLDTKESLIKGMQEFQIEANQIQKNGPFRTQKYILVDHEPHAMHSDPIEPPESSSILEQIYSPESLIKESPTAGTEQEETSISTMDDMSPRVLHCDRKSTVSPISEMTSEVEVFSDSQQGAKSLILSPDGGVEMRISDHEDVRIDTTSEATGDSHLSTEHLNSHLFDNETQITSLDSVERKNTSMSSICSDTGSLDDVKGFVIHSDEEIECSAVSLDSESIHSGLQQEHMDNNQSVTSTPKMVGEEADSPIDSDSHTSHEESVHNISTSIEDNEEKQCPSSTVSDKALCEEKNRTRVASSEEIYQTLTPVNGRTLLSDHDMNQHSDDESITHESNIFPATELSLDSSRSLQSFSLNDHEMSTPRSLPFESDGEENVDIFFEEVDIPEGLVFSPPEDAKQFMKKRMEEALKLGHITQRTPTQSFLDSFALTLSLFGCLRLIVIPCIFQLFHFIVFILAKAFSES